MAGSSDKASKQAQANEEARQRAIRGTQSAVNGVFDGPQRAADIADFVGATRQYYQGDLDTKKADADRNLKFALARNGQLGGSTQNDQQEVLGKDYTKGLLEVNRKATGAGAALEGADQDARARLLQLATSGLDSTTGASMAASAMRNNLEVGQSAAQMQGIGEVFGSMSDFWKKSQDAAVRRKADQQAYGLYGPNANFSYGGAS